MRLNETSIPGCFELVPPAFRDNRGSFVKHFHRDQFEALGLETCFPEEFYTRSSARVLRGLHCMVPPFDQVKVVTCVFGSVLDAVVDLRRGSPTYGKYILTALDAERCNMLYIGKGMAHGFYVPTGEAVLLYRVSTMHSPLHDKGIRWDSAGIPWQVSDPVVSSRDMALPTLQDFECPFEFPWVYA